MIQKSLPSNIYAIYFILFCCFLFLFVYTSSNDKANAHYQFQCFYFQIFEVEIMMVHIKKTMLRVVKIVLKTKKSIICNFVLSMPFLLLFLYFARGLGKVITSTNFVE
jgi:hypothetical protein